MFVLYLMNNETRDYETITRSKRSRLAVMYANESLWIVARTASLDG
jgi:hypothetical protein